MRRLPLFVALLGSASVAHAGDKVLYAPAAAWVKPAPAITPAMLADDAAAVVVFDAQTRLDQGVAYTYLDTATRAVSAQTLAQMGNVALPWLPDRGDLTVHRVEIVRGNEKIDLLAGGTRFTVLRREEQMEQRMLTGLLTATLSAEGLRVGDVLRISFTISQAEPALKGRMNTVAPVIAAPTRAGFARAILSWPSAAGVKWKGYQEGLKPVERDEGGYHEVAIAMPLPKQPEMPGDLPQRYVKPPIVEASNFADWREVSRTLAPLYATDGLIAPGSPLAGEVAKIAAADKDPLKRTQAALELVENQIRYLALAMDGGGLTPQAPARTWSTRYGDCKAKTLMLLAMLRALGVEAEAVAASLQTGGLVAERLPGAGAFDHVLVRATVGGRTLWLDGTRLGDRIEDIGNTPPFRYVLPLRTAGADLMPLPIAPLARPTRTINVAYDQSAGVDMPSVFDVRVVVRGQLGQLIDEAWREAGEKRRELVGSVIQGEVGEPQIATYSVTSDKALGEVTVAATGVVTTKWVREEGRRRMTLDRAVGAIGFTPDRTRAAWRALPVATEGPDSVVYRTTVTLPGNGEGFAIEGDRTLPATLAGRQTTRTVSLSGRTLIAEDRIDAVGAEIAPDALPAARAGYARAKGNLLRAAAPRDTPPRAASVLAARRDGRYKPLEAVYTAAIAQTPDEAGAYQSRANFRRAIFDWKGALADTEKVVALEPAAGSYIARGSLHYALGDRKAALADYLEAQKLDPSSDEALARIARVRFEDGDAKGAIALLDERIARGDRGSAYVTGDKAQILAQTGQGEAAVALMDEAIAARPGDQQLLNSRCWVKGIGAVALESALKDCTKAIELAESPAAALDSRALVYFRLGRMEEALADVNAALEIYPDMEASRYLRGMILRRTGKTSEGDADLAMARLMEPQIDQEYARYGIKP